MERGWRVDRRAVTLSAMGAMLAGCAALRPASIQVIASAPAEEPDAHLDTGVDQSQRVTAPVRINGQGPFDFVVDTGANRSVIAAELALQLNLPDGGAAMVHGVAGVEPAPTSIVKLFQADAVTARDLRMPVLSRERLGADGLLGVDVLHNRRVLIDFRAHRLTIAINRGGDFEPSTFDVRSAAAGRGADLGRRVAVPARYRFGQLIIIGADVVGRSVTAFVDSGSQSTVGNNALRRLALSSRATDPKAARMTTPIFSATGQTAEGEVGQMPLLRVGGLDIIGLTTVFADLHVFDIWGLQSRPTLMLGMDVLSRFNALELNYGTREVVFYLAPKTRSR
jgi:predicted aspartyl protease